MVLNTFSFSIVSVLSIKPNDYLFLPQSWWKKISPKMIPETNSMGGRPIFHWLPMIVGILPSRELTYPPFKGTFEDDFPFPQVGYVSIPWRVHYPLSNSDKKIHLWPPEEIRQSPNSAPRRKSDAGNWTNPQKFELCPKQRHIGRFVAPKKGGAFGKTKKLIKTPCCTKRIREFNASLFLLPDLIHTFVNHWVFSSV